MSSGRWWMRCGGRLSKQKNAAYDANRRIDGAISLIAGLASIDHNFYTSSMEKIEYVASSNSNRGFHFSRGSGFTLIELLVTIAIVAIILALGLPSLRVFLVRNQVGSITSEFASDVARTRIEAISRNGCVTICASTTTNTSTPTCGAVGSPNWQAGWIIFSNPACGTGITTPDAANPLISVRQSGPSSFELESTVGDVSRVMFDSRGLTNSNQGKFILRYVPESISSPHYRTLCLSSAGRVRVKKYAENCP